MTPPDPLRDLLDLVQESLSEPALTGADLAGRAFLSQFHFSRLVKASLGEPPGAFRRRLLLERAAYRLQSSADSVLTVALDVGYGSSEAFSRAFSRAFGHAPSEHRSGDTCVIEGPSGIHFHPPGGLVLPAPRRSSAMDLVVRMLDHHLWLSGEILDRAGTLPDAVLDAPIEVSVEGIDRDPTLRSLGARLVTQLEMWLGALDGASEVPAPGETSPAALRARLDLAGPRFRSRMVSVLEQGRADDTFVDATCQPPQVFSHGGVLAHVLTFSAVRRTMAVGALEDAGITDLGSGDPMAFVGGSGDDASTLTRT